MTTLFQQFRLNSSITILCICYKFHYLLGYVFACSPQFLFKRKTSRCFSKELCSSFANFCLNTRGFVSDKDITTSGLIKSHEGILKSLKGCIISKGRLKSSTSFCTLNPIDFVHVCFCHTHS